MGKKIVSFLISTRFTAVLFILFPLSMGIGTFIESYYNTTTAKILIYNVGSKDNLSVIKLVNMILGLMKRKDLKPIILKDCHQ